MQYPVADSFTTKVVIYLTHFYGEDPEVQFYNR